MDRPELNTINSQEGTRGKEKLRNRSLAALSAIGVAVLAACGPNAEASQNTPPAPETTTSAEAPSTTEPTEAETEPAPSAIEQIPAGLAPEALAQASVDAVDTWIFTGATEDDVEETFARTDEITDEKNENFEDYSMEEIYLQIATENATDLTPSIFPEDWQNIEGAVAYREKLINLNALLMEQNVARHLNGEPLIDWSYEISDVKELENPEELTETERRLSFIVTTTHLESTDPPVKEMNVRTFDEASGVAVHVGEAGNRL